MIKRNNMILTLALFAIAFSLFYQRRAKETKGKRGLFSNQRHAAEIKINNKKQRLWIDSLEKLNHIQLYRMERQLFDFKIQAVEGRVLEVIGKQKNPAYPWSVHNRSLLAKWQEQGIYRRLLPFPTRPYISINIYNLINLAKMAPFMKSVNPIRIVHGGKYGSEQLRKLWEVVLDWEALFPEQVEIFYLPGIHRDPILPHDRLSACLSQHEPKKLRKIHDLLIKEPSFDFQSLLTEELTSCLQAAHIERTINGYRRLVASLGPLQDTSLFINGRFIDFPKEQQLKPILSE